MNVNGMCEPCAVLYNKKWIHFGDNRYEDFTIHKDPERRQKYLKRAMSIRDKQGNLTANNNGNYHIMHRMI